MKLYKKLKTPKGIFMMLVLFLDVAAIISFAITKGDSLKYLVWHAGTWGIYPDLFESLKDASMSNPYETGAIYPALVYSVLSFVSGTNVQKWQDWGGISVQYTGFIVGSLFFLLATIILCNIISKILKLTYEQAILFSVIVTLSPGYLFMLERGNLVIIAVILILIYTEYYQSENAYLKEIALISLAIAANFKIYPAILGLLLLIKKDYKSAVRCIIYALLLFVVPFGMKGGFSQIQTMVSNIFTFSKKANGNLAGWGYGFRVNIANVATAILMHFGIGEKTIELICRSLEVAYVMISVAGAIIAQKQWQKVFALVSIMVLVPGFSWIFTEMYLFVPLTFFLKEETRLNKMNLFYIFWMALIFAPLPYGEICKGLPGIQNITYSNLFGTVATVIITVSFLVASWKKKIDVKRNISKQS